MQDVKIFGHRFQYGDYTIKGFYCDRRFIPMIDYVHALYEKDGRLYLQTGASNGPVYRWAWYITNPEDPIEKWEGYEFQESLTHGRDYRSFIDWVPRIRKLTIIGG